MLSNTTRGIVADRPFTYVELERQALDFRRALGYGIMDLINGPELYDRVQEYTVTVAGKSHRVFCRVEPIPDGREAKAMFNPDSDDYDIVLTEQTYEWLEKGHPRGRSSILHECGHVVLHAVLLQKLTQLPIYSQAALFSGEGKPHNFYLDTEWQADALASAIAMPARAIRKLEVELREQCNPLLRIEGIIQKHFRVSPDAAEFRWGNYHFRSTRLLGVKP